MAHSSQDKAGRPTWEAPGWPDRRGSEGKAQARAFIGFRRKPCTQGSRARNGQLKSSVGSGHKGVEEYCLPECKSQSGEVAGSRC